RRYFAHAEQGGRNQQGGRSVTAPSNLRVEHVDEPLGIDVRCPRLSWQLPDGARIQVTYQLRAGSWDTGRVDADPSGLVPYAGPTLECGERVEWTVKVWSDLGESGWSEPAWWEMGLLEPGDWVARWIEPDVVGEVDAIGRGPAPVYVFRRCFSLTGPLAKGRV